MGVNTTSRMNPKVVGFCDPKYEKVKKHLENMLVNGSDENFQLCVYVEGKCVIDLYGISDENSSYNANKTQVNFNYLDQANTLQKKKAKPLKIIPS